ncbi:MAG: hypothetical protein R3330_15220, partial [Saprospiraceae bacterium]|nr:hypothetical protein [Saprospiraceae bacterium]
MRWLLLICGVGMCVGHLSAQQDQPDPVRFNNISVREANFVGYYYTTACEDPYGYMWFGGRRGVVRFDGRTMQPLNEHFQFDALGTHIVFRIIRDRHDQMWMTNAGAVYKVDPATLDYVVYDFREHEANHNISPDLEMIYEDRQGRIWVTGRNGLYQYLPEENWFAHDRYRDIDHLNENAIIDIDQDYYQDDLFWLGTNSGGLQSFNRRSGEFHAYRFSTSGHIADTSDVFTNVVWSVHSDADSLIWLYTAVLNDLVSFDPRTGAWQRYPL